MPWWVLLLADEAIFAVLGWLFARNPQWGIAARRVIGRLPMVRRIARTRRFAKIGKVAAFAAPALAAGGALYSARRWLGRIVLSLPGLRKLRWVRVARLFA
ncbi:MAG: hypothetical protein ACOZNI_08550 [Myxococcota bacterium]